MAKQDTFPTERSGKFNDDLLMDQDVQALIQQMVDRGSYILLPTVNEKGIAYSTLSGILPNKTEEEKKQFLSDLAFANILDSKLLDKIIVCPSCGSPAVYSKYNCPRCSAFDIGRASIVEHTPCGYVGSKEKFRKGGSLICPNPRCTSRVTDSSLKMIGTTFACNACGSRFESPKISHKCNSCEDVFTYKEALYEPIYQYELTEDAKRTIARGTLPLASMVDYLRNRGFEVGLKKELVGRSGATHIFDIVAQKGDELIVGNFTFEPKEEDIIGLFAKKYDIDPTHTLLLGLTPATREEEAVAKAYGVVILSSGGTTTLVQQIAALTG